MGHLPHGPRRECTNVRRHRAYGVRRPMLAVLGVRESIPIRSMRVVIGYLVLLHTEDSGFVPVSESIVQWKSSSIHLLNDSVWQAHHGLTIGFQKRTRVRCGAEDECPLALGAASTNVYASRRFALVVAT
jgi:hypothetical protein